MDALLLLFRRANMTCIQHQHSIPADEFMILFHLKLALSESFNAPISFHIRHLSIYGINPWFFETFREGPWCRQSLHFSGPWAIIIHQMGDLSTFQPLTSMIHWKTPGLYRCHSFMAWCRMGFSVEWAVSRKKMWRLGFVLDRWITTRKDRSDP